MTIGNTSLDRSISAATRALLDCQFPGGEWCFELEADCTIPAEYVLLRHYLGARSRSTCGGRRALGMAAGRCSRTAISTPARRSKAISH